MQRLTRTLVPEEAFDHGDAFKEALAWSIANVIRERQLTQAQASELVGLTRANVSCIMNGKLAEISLERLIRAARRISIGIDVTITQYADGEGPMRVTSL